VPFPVLLLTLNRSRFQAKPATLLIPIDFLFFFAVEELYGTRYQSGSFSLFMWGVVLTMFDVPDPLVVHVLLLTNEFIYIMLFASLILGILSVTDPCFLRAQKSQIIPPI
jgi:hypothetical protein